MAGSWALFLAHDKTHWNNCLDSESHLGPRSGGTHTHAEYLVIMKGPLREEYKRERRNKRRRLERNPGKRKTREKREN